MKLELARQNDFDAIIASYDDVTVHTPNMAHYARWSKVDNNISMLRIPAGRTFISLNLNNSVIWIK